MQIKRGNGMNDRVDKSRGIVTLMSEDLPNINPIEPLRLVKQSVRIKRNLRWENRSGARPGARVPGLEMPWNPGTNLALGPNDSNLF